MGLRNAKFAYVQSTTGYEAYSQMVGMFFYVRHLETSKIARKIQVQRLIRQRAHEATFEEQNYETKETTTYSTEHNWLYSNFYLQSPQLYI